MSIYRFLRLFKALTFQTPRQYLLATRLRAAVDRLIETPDRVLDIAYDVGFGDISHFNQVFAATRLLPSPIRQQPSFGKPVHQYLIGLRVEGRHPAAIQNR